MNVRSEPPPARSEEPSAVGVRRAVEFLASLIIGVVVFRTFQAEAYMVPTGSMAPTLMGIHKDVTCPACGCAFAVDIRLNGAVEQAVCPNCGYWKIDSTAAPTGNGDRLLVQKYLFDYRPPRRWEVAVFRYPNDPSQAYVKRVVGLPGERIEIIDGDVYCNGRIATKSLDEARAVRIPVFDTDLTPTDPEWRPRWNPRAEGSHWQGERSKFLIDGRSRPEVDDWLEYRHWVRERRAEDRVTDFYGYDGPDQATANAVRDVMLEAQIRVNDGIGAVLVELTDGRERFELRLPVGGESHKAQLFHNGRAVSTAAMPALGREKHRLEATMFDRQVLVALDGQPVLPPYDFTPAVVTPPSTTRPVALGVRGLSLEASHLKLFRDIYYTGATPDLRQAFGIGKPYALGEDEYFMLGDNSPISQDSRFWEKSPVVRADLFLGKPFCVHLPSRGVHLTVFGRDLDCSVPNWPNVRYIR